MTLTSLTARQLTAKITHSKSLQALVRLYEQHGTQMDRLHLSALLHRCGHLAETKTSQVPRSLLPDVLQRCPSGSMVEGSRQVQPSIFGCEELAPTSPNHGRLTFL
ncbi:unnamed protein product, partial [Durusdinium trenchii]